MNFAALDASNPGGTWPLRKEPDALDLRWVRMSEGKKVLWEATDPLRPGSTFRPVAPRVFDDWGYMAGTEQLGA